MKHFFATATMAGFLRSFVPLLRHDPWVRRVASWVLGGAAYVAIADGLVGPSDRVGWVAADESPIQVGLRLAFIVILWALALGIMLTAILRERDHRLQRMRSHPPERVHDEDDEDDGDDDDEPRGPVLH